MGKPTSHTGPNGLTTTWAYDTFGRKIQETRADGTQTKWAYQYCSGVNGGTATCPSGASYLVQTTPYAADGATVNGPVVTAYLDGLNREVGRDTQGFDGSTVRATKTYDALGRVSQTSRPYFLSNGTPQQAGPATQFSGPFSGTVSVQGQSWEYRGYGLPSGKINVGTYFPVNR